MVDTPTVNRRTALKGIGGLATLGLGGYALTGSAGAALTSTFDADPVTVASDTGDVDDIHLAPESTVEWHDFDVPITKVRQLIAGRITADGSVLTGGNDGVDGSFQDGLSDGAGVWPIWRETPWMFETGVSEPADFYYNATGVAGDPANFSQAPYMSEFDVEGFPNQKEKATSGEFTYTLAPSASPDRDPTVDPLIYVAREGYPRPEYVSDYDDRYLTGTSIAGGGNYLNGSYGTLGDTSLLDNAEDDTIKTFTVELWLLTTLHTDYDFAENPSRTGSGQADRYSPLAMARSGEYHIFADEAATPYGDLAAHADDHPAIDLESTSFTVTVDNEPAATGSGTTANTGGS